MEVDSVQIYILAYHHLHHSQQQTGCNIPLQHSIIDKVVKQFKCHRNAQDFDGKFVSDVVVSVRIEQEC